VENTIKGVEKASAVIVVTKIRLILISRFVLLNLRPKKISQIVHFSTYTQVFLTYMRDIKKLANINRWVSIKSYGPQ
jgi:hypothetical protein